MDKIFIIIEENGYDGFDFPSDYFYLTEDEADKECAKLNKARGSRRDSFFVHEMELKK